MIGAAQPNRSRARRLGSVVAGSVRLPLLALLLAGSTGMAAAQDVVIGLTAWPSAKVSAYVIGQVLAERTGVTPVYVERGSVGLLTSIVQGDMDVYPELWSPNLDAAIDRAGAAVTISPHAVTGRQGICATRAAVDQTGIKAVSDLTNPDIAAAFDSDDDGRGELWIGDASWFSTQVEQVRARSAGYDKTMQLLQMPEDLAMAAVDASVALAQPMVFYCYSPHHVFVLHDVVMLAEPAFDAAAWQLVAPAEDANWLQHSRAGTAWDVSSLSIAFATRLNSELPAVADVLDRIQFEPEDLAGMSYALQVERKSPEDAAREWLAAHRDRMDGWFE
jgi:glycine betaine/proline transport system substrate-binding protein